MEISLSDLLWDIRIERPTWGMIHLGASGGLHIERDQRTFVYLVVSGTVSLRAAGMPQAYRLQGGDVLFAFHPAWREISAGPESVVALTDFFSKEQRADTVPIVSADGATVTAKVLVGAFRINLTPLNDTMRLVPDVLLFADEPEGQGLSSPSSPSPWMRRSPWLRTAWKNLEEFEKNLAEPGAVAYVSRMAEAMLMRALRAVVLEQRPGGVLVLQSLTEPKISLAQRLVRERLDERWTVQRLAREVGMSRTAFALGFTGVVGETPMSYVTRLRMGKAAEMLTHGRDKIATIAMQVGYESEGSFSRVFRRHFKCAPGAFRSSKRQALLGTLDDAES